jgi:hypothetical protein
MRRPLVSTSTTSTSRTVMRPCFVGRYANSASRVSFAVIRAP